MTTHYGFLLLDKPEGMTSRDAVNRVVRISREKRIGHAGTLDPFATGLLVLAVGRATRLIECVQRMPKTYEAVVRFGCRSDTDDRTGNLAPAPIPDAPTIEQIRTAGNVGQTFLSARGGRSDLPIEQILEVLPTFIGRIQQVPPAFSALKVAGKRAYDLARAGQAVELKQREVEIHDIAITRFDYPLLHLTIRCGSGTYIRSLARDLGEKLSVGGLLEELRRTRIGVYEVESASTLDELAETDWTGRLLPIETAASALPGIVVDAADERRFRQGQRLAIPSDFEDGADLVAVFGSEQRFLGLARPDWESASLKPLKTGFGDV